MAPIQQFIKDCWGAEAEEVKSRTTVDALDLGPDAVDGVMFDGSQKPGIDEDVGTSEEEYQPDLEGPKRVTRGATKTTKRTPSTKFLPSPPPKRSTTKRKAIVDETQSKDELSEADLVQAGSKSRDQRRAPCTGTKAQRKNWHPGHPPRGSGRR